MSIRVRGTARGRRYDVMLRDRDGVQHSKTFATKRAAVEYEARQMALLADAVFIAPRASGTTVEELSGRWLASGSKRQSTRMRDQSIAAKHVVPGLGARRAIGAISRADCQATVDRWLAAGLAPRTVVRQAAALRAMLQYAVDADLITRNPASRLKLPRVAAVERPALSGDDLERLGVELGPEQAAFMWCGAILGLRWAETAGLSVGSLDTVRSTVSVQAQVDRHGQLVAPKTAASIRTLAAPQWLVNDLASIARDRGVALTDRGALVLVNQAGAPHSYPNWRTRVWQPATARAGRPGLHYHDLRSVAASALVAAGVDLRTAMHRLGHTTPTMTLSVYARVAEDRDRAAAEAVAARLTPHR